MLDIIAQHAQCAPCYDKIGGGTHTVCVEVVGTNTRPGTNNLDTYCTVLYCMCAATKFA